MNIQDELNYIGKAISICRLGHSQLEISKISGVTQQQISKIGAGGNCTVTTLLKILNALSVNIVLPFKFPSPEVQALNRKACRRV